MTSFELDALRKKHISDKFRNVKFCCIYAKDKDNLIGINVTNKTTGDKHYHMPWDADNKEDLKFFRMQTTDQVCIMGYNTFVSLGSKPLKSRLNIVITNRHYDKLSEVYRLNTNIKLARSIEEAVIIGLQHADQNVTVEKIFFIGGKSIYDVVWNSVDIHYVTEIGAYHKYRWENDINEEVENIYLQDIDLTKFRIKRFSAQIKDGLQYTWKTYIRHNAILSILEG